MNVRIGRNDPCHCGSGRKYKRCHLAEDEERERRERAEAAAAAEAALSAPAWAAADSALPVLNPPLFPDIIAEDEDEDEGEPEDEAWGRFEATDDADERIRIFEQEVMEADEPRVELAFEMLAELHGALVERGERQRFQNLVDRLHAAHPDVYAADQIWYLSWEIEDAAAEGAYERIPPLMEPLAEVAAPGLDEVFRLIDLLMFHDQAAPLVTMMRRAWPAVSASDTIFPHAIARFAATLTMLQIFLHLEAGGAPRADDPALRAALAPLGDFDDDRLQRSLDALAGGTARPWQPADFVRVPDAGRARDGGMDDEDEYESLADLEAYNRALEAAAVAPHAVHLHDLLDDDDDDAADLLDLPDEDGEHATDTARIVVDAAADAATAAAEAADDPEAELRERLLYLSLEWAAALRREHGVPLSRVEMMRDELIEYLLTLPPGKANVARLLPDKASFERRLANLMDFFSGRFYRAATLFALAPAYIDMLAARGLVKRDAARRARMDILSLRPTMLRLAREATHDPALHAAVERAGA